TLGDKIIFDLDKTTDFSQRSPQNCPKCGNPVKCHYCQGCDVLRQKFKEDLFASGVKHGIIQDSFELSNDNSNVANAPREPFVVNQDLGCVGTVLTMDIIVHQKSRLSLIRNLSTIKPLRSSHQSFDPKSDLIHKSPNIFNPPSQLPFISCEFYENDARYGHYCTPQVSLVYPEPCYNQDFNFPQEFQEAQAANARYWKIPACYDDDDDYNFAITPNKPVNSLSMGDEHPDTVPATKSDEFIKSSVENLIPIPCEFDGIPENICDVPFHDNSLPLDVLKDQFKDFFDSNDEFSSIDDDSFSSDNIDYVEASPLDSELVRSEMMEIVIPEVGGIDNDILLTIKDDILHEKLLNVNLLIAKIEALNDNPTPSSDFMTKSSSTSLNSLLEETNNFDNSLPEFKTFCFDVEEISSGSTTTRSDISLPKYEVFYDDHVKEISSGSTTTHSVSSLYESFIFDISINPFPPANKSNFYEFADELIHFISPPKYDCFLFKIEPNSGDFTMDVVEDISPTRELRVHNALPTHPTLQLNLKFQPSSESLFTYVVWIFLPFLVYSVAPQYLLFLRNEDTIFDPGICNYHFSFRPAVSHRCGTFPRFKVLPKSLMEIFSSTYSPMDQ
nr:hypothetical protein [Tanacetum cinerariifolium]